MAIDYGAEKQRVVTHDPHASEMKNNTRGNGKPLLDLTRCNFNIEFRPSKIHRWGAFANEQIPARRRVIEYTGERISWDEAERRDKRKRLYIFWLSEKWALDGAIGGSGAEFINHSCDPNMIARIVNGHIYLSANRRIEPGEELTYDYNIDDDKAAVKCNCGAPNCGKALR